jgi:hypothetical protein
MKLYVSKAVHIEDIFERLVQVKIQFEKKHIKHQGLTLSMKLNGPSNNKRILKPFI